MVYAEDYGRSVGSRDADCETVTVTGSARLYGKIEVITDRGGFLRC